MRRLLQVREEAEHLRAGLDRYSYLWQSDRRGVMQEFLTYSRQLRPEELEAEETPPTLKDFQRQVRNTCPGVSVVFYSRCFQNNLYCKCLSCL